MPEQRHALWVGGPRHGEVIDMGSAPSIGFRIDDDEHGHVVCDVKWWSSNALMSQAEDGNPLALQVVIHPETYVMPETSTAILDAVLRAVRRGRELPIREYELPPGPPYGGRG
jgi:hypothetical protein